jgi:hypothetical protein
MLRLKPLGLMVPSFVVRHACCYVLCPCPRLALRWSLIDAGWLASRCPRDRSGTGAALTAAVTSR